ncbi:MAG: helix-turn-helix domain-containing protein [Candidatus Thiodiazotropha sp. (ex Dulcina madagascariensis)]|nr:helix-turn-helix domain-containing protein [Candidatus Thiodiazotropha sp. (ex Dulcina madagascariensis)]
MAIDHEKAQQRLGAVIRSQRKALGYSQEAFASHCGVHRTYMGAVERGQRNISLMNIIRIANALIMKPSELLALAKL